MELLSQFKTKYGMVKLGLSLTLAIGFLYLLSPFVAPILLSLIFAFALEPTIARVSDKKIARLRYTCLALVVTGLIVVSAPLAFLSFFSYSEIHQISGAGIDQSRIYQAFLHLRESLIASLENWSTQFKLQLMFRSATVVDQGINLLSAYLANELPKLVAGLPGLALSFLVFNMMLFLCLFRARSIKAIYLKTHALRHSELNYLIYSLQTSCRAALIATVLTGFMHAILFTSGSWIFAVGQPVLVFPVTFICSFLPLIGTLPVTLLLVADAMIVHNYGGAVGILAFAFLSSMIDYWMRVHFMVDESKRIHPALSLIGLVGAIIHFGFAGVLFGPLEISLAAMIIPKFLAPGKQHYRISKLKLDTNHLQTQSPQKPTIPPKSIEDRWEKTPWIN